MIAAMHLGTGVETRIRDLAETIRDVVGYEGKTVWGPLAARRPAGALPGASRARGLIGFEARMPPGEGPRRTMESFRSSGAARGA